MKFSLNYVKGLFTDIGLALVDGYKAASADFKDGFDSVSVETTLAAQREALADAKNARREHGHKTAKTKIESTTESYKKSLEKDLEFGKVINDLKAKVADSYRILGIVGSANPSTMFKVGVFVRNPIKNTVEFIRNTYKSLTTTDKVVYGTVILGLSVLMAAAIKVLGLSLLCTTTITAAASIAFSRLVFIKYGISASVECVVDVSIFVLYTMFLMY
jgi:hypothetical protein